MKKTTKIGKAPAIRAALAICAALALALALSGCDNNVSPGGDGCACSGCPAAEMNADGGCCWGTPCGCDPSGHCLTV